MTASPPVLTIDIMRHGQTEADAAKLYGATDVPLSREGKQAMRKAAMRIHREPIAQVVSSPLQRCAWLAQYLHEHQHIPYTLHVGFAEMNFGDWEGQNTEALLAKHPCFRSDVSQLKPPRGETFTQFQQRVMQAWQQHVAAHITQGGHHLLIAHGGVIRVLLAHVLHVPSQYLHHLYVPHAAWSRISLTQGEPPMLWFMNHHA